MHAFIFYGFISYLVHTTSQMIAGNVWALFRSSGLDPYRFYLTDYIWLGFSFSGLQTAAIFAGLIALIGLTVLAMSKLKLGKRNYWRTNAGIQWFFLSLLLVEFLALFALAIGSGTAIYEGIVNHFSLLVLLGLGYFAYRRWLRRATGLDIPSAQSAIVLLLIGTLMTSTLISAATQASLEGGAHNWVQSMVLALLHGLGMTTVAEAEALRSFGWWVHIATVYSFMVFVPLSKHSHLIFAPINFLLIRNTPRGALRLMDLENSAVYGAGNVSELGWTSLLDGLSCIECGRCTVQCPANRTGKPLDPKKIMVDVKHATIEHAGAIMAASAEEGPAASPVVGGAYISEEELWGCTSCYACVEACPVGNNQLEAIMEMRRNLVLVESRFPAELQNAFNNMENQSNPWGMGAHTRADWCSDLGVKTLAEDSKVDVLYWVGCAASFDDRNKRIARSFVQIMQQAKVNFGILGTEENCTGDSARRGGNEYLYQTLAQTNIETLNRYGVKKIVTACPHCYNTLKNEYPQLGGNYEVQHHSDFIDDLVRTGKVEMDASEVEKMSDRRAVFHDSCYLGRYNEIFDEPRNLVKAAVGADLAEPGDHHRTSLCCGAGGAQMWMEEHYERVNIKRTEQLLDTGADTIATACPFCNVMITDGVKAKGLDEDVKVLDVAELVASTMKGGSGAVSGGFASKESAISGHHH
ncbi:MAG: (Fe-S)-binding protein [Leptospirales bacterium]|nr:(Fe-S)-binding protein [Leptospirales bacterium]